MDLKTCFRAFLVSVLLLLIAECAHGSTKQMINISNNNESQASKDNNSTEFPSGNVESTQKSSVTLNNVNVNMPIEDIELDVQTPPTLFKNSSTTEPASNNTSHEENQVSPVPVITAKGNAINQFALRVGHHIFHHSPEAIITVLANNSKKQDQSSPNLGTIVWSPFSVYQALVPLYYAADGETRKELADVLSLAGISGKPQVLQDAQETNPLGTEEDRNQDKNELTSNIVDKTFDSATGIFARNDVPLNPAYVEQIRQQVKNVKIETIDFSENPGVAVKNINTWAREITHGLINEAVDETQVNPNMVMMIVNCVRFKAPWRNQFVPKLTKVATFYGVRGVQQVQMMKQIGIKRFGTFPIVYSSDYLDEDAEQTTTEPLPPPFSVLEMPYADSNLLSLFILPKTTDKLQETLDYVEKLGVGKIREKLDNVDVEVLMPKFKVNSDVKVEEALIENGVKSLFDPLTANLAKLVAPHYQNSSSNDTATPKLLLPRYVNNIVHRTIFETTEEGTSAAAITAVSIVPLSALSSDRVHRFNLNRPFIVLLVQNDNTVMFQGVIADLIGQDLKDGPAGDVFLTKYANKESTSTTNVAEKVTLDVNRSGLVKKTTPNDDFQSDSGKVLVNYKGDTLNSKESTAPANDLSQSTVQQQIDVNGTNMDTSYEERSWWVPQRIPEYLQPQPTVSGSSIPQSSTDKEVTSSFIPMPVAGPTSVKETVNEFIQFIKYQQPEPKDPNGIRFPATVPKIRNNMIVKPRFEETLNGESERGKGETTPLTRWMNVYYQ